MVFVRITAGEDIKAGVTIGSVFKAESYRLDPRDKFTLIIKVSGPGRKYKPYSMNHYRNELEIIRRDERISLGLE